MTSSLGDGRRLERGDVIADRFRLDSLIGEGGSGGVWAAEHLVTGKLVALKVLKPSVDSSAWRGRILREARAACAVRHPNVVAVHDVIEAPDGSPALVMDLLEGETLRARLEHRGALSVHETVELVLPIVSAVGTAHARGIVHRDLKPENVFLTREGGSAGVRVLDFGIAKLTAVEGAAPAESLTATGSVVGTIYYMAPEQVYGERDIDHRADIWAIGVILYECLSGRRPTEAANVGQVFKLITAGGISPLEEVSPHVPAEIAGLVAQMLTRDVARRPDLRSAAEVLARFASTATPPFREPFVGVISPSASPRGHVSPVATTETFEGVGLVAASRVPSSTQAASQSKPQPVASGRGRVLGVVSLAAAVVIAIVVPLTFRIRSAEIGKAPPVEASIGAPGTVAADTSAPAAPAAPASADVPREVPASVRSSAAVHAATPPTVSHAKTALDAGAPAAPGAPSNAAASPRATPQGIVDTPPF